MDRRLQYSLLLFSFLALLIPNARAKVYYVSSSAGTDGNRTKAEAGNPLTPWKTIQFALDSADAGDTVSVAAGNYVGSTVINKAVSLIGVSNAGAKPVLTGPALKVLHVLAPNVTISNFQILMNTVEDPQLAGHQTDSLFGIKAENGFDNLTITDCFFLATGNSTTNKPELEWNAFGIFLDGTTEMVTVKRNVFGQTNLNTGVSLGRSIRIWGCQGVIGGPNPADSNYTLSYLGIQMGRPGGPFTIQHNTLNGAGLDIYGIAAGTTVVADNKFNAIVPRYVLTQLDIKGITKANSFLDVRRNTFYNFGYFFAEQ